MKFTLSLASGILLVCTVTFAQKPPIKFGDIPMEDMKMTVYPADSGAAAVVLADFGTSTLEYSRNLGFQLHFDRIRRIKILKQEGLSHAEFMIPLWAEASGANQEKLTGLKVNTYNLENGKIVETKTKNDAVFKEKYDRNLTYMKGAWTNVKVGSVIEISYGITSEFVFNFQDWDFQTTIPTRLSEYRAKIPEYFNYQKYMQGYIGLTVNDTEARNAQIVFQPDRAGDTPQTVNYREDNFRWVAENVPAFKREPYITTANDYISRMNFELAFTKFPGGAIKTYMGTWEDINNSYLGDVKSEINSAMGLKDDVAKAIAGATSDEQKVAMIFDYVRQSVVWDETDRRYPDKDPWKTLEAKKGSSAEINILLACLLDKIKIPVKPVLLSTRDHGFVREAFPLMSQFNYVICLAQVGTKSILLDATDRMLPIGTLPERCLNGNGMAVSAEGPQWVSLQPSIKTRTVYAADLAIEGNGSVKGTLKIDKSGYHSASARRRYHAKGEGEYMKEFAKDPVWSFSDSKFENANDISLPFKETHQIAAIEASTATPGTIYFNPIILGREEENPFKTEKREYPVDFGNQFDQIYTARITIPEGYVVDELPPSKLLNLPENAARYMYNVSQQGNVINVTSSLFINRTLFAQDIYPNLREFFNLIIAKQAEQVVLKKK